MRYSYNSRILRVVLSNRVILHEEPDEICFRTYLGRKGMASYYLLKELKPGIDPFSPENKVILTPSVIKQRQEGNGRWNLKKS